MSRAWDLLAEGLKQLGPRPGESAKQSDKKSVPSGSRNASRMHSRRSCASGGSKARAPRCLAT